MKRLVLPANEDGPPEAGGAGEKVGLHGPPPNNTEHEKVGKVGKAGNAEKAPAPQKTAVAGPQIGDKQSTPLSQRHVVPPELLDICTQSIKVGAACGAAGTIVGYGFGLYKPGHPKLFAALSGVHWAALSSTFWGYRLLAIRYLEGGADVTPRQKVQASAIAGGLAGMTIGLLRSPQNALYGTVAWSLYGAGGQATVDWWHSRPKKQEQAGGSFWDSKYSPLQRLSDHDYAEILEKRLLHVEATLAVVDDNIQALQEEKRRHEASVSNSKPGKPDGE